MRATAPILVLLLGAAASLALSACGSGGNAKLLPGRTAEEIEANLEEVQRMAGEGECVGARDAAQQIGSEVEQLGVDAQLKQALSEGTERLDQVLASCREATEVEEEPEPLTTEEEASEKPGKAEKQLEKEEEQEAKEAEKAEKEAEKEAQQQEVEEEAQEVEEEAEAVPPPAGGKGKGPEGTGPPGQEGAPSGGVGPGVAAGGGG